MGLQGFEMKSFDEWFKLHQKEVFKNGQGCFDGGYKLGAKIAYKAGAASRQAEIDELQKKYDAMYRAFTVADDARKEWHRCYVGARQREDELQKRIDKAIIELSKVSNMHVINARDILKGKQDD